MIHSYLIKALHFLNTYICIFIYIYVPDEGPTELRFLLARGRGLASFKAIGLVATANDFLPTAQYT
jgi:hypothetical protein